ncbi:DUF5681 domain-containing protein [Rhizorhabdus histidinilytica]|uniref:DUF5681 domain-containing protein n=1 Tax=Rhizorhabdus histidinilytica TaxID=439228 RepID=UPI00321FDDDC
MANEQKGGGYGKPPRGKPFKPGKSGNPKGRPKGAKGLATLASEIIYSPVDVMQNGESKRMSALAAVLHRTKVDAIKGDKAAAERFLKLAEKYGAQEEQSVAPPAPSDRLNVEDFIQTLSVFEIDILALINSKARGDLDEVAESRRTILKYYGQQILDLIGDEETPLPSLPP